MHGRQTPDALPKNVVSALPVCATKRRTMRTHNVQYNRGQQEDPKLAIGREWHILYP